MQIEDSGSNEHMVENWSQRMFRATLKVFLFVSILLGALGQLAGQEGSSFPLPHDATLIIRLKNLTESQAPFVSHNLLFFTYKGSAQTKVVGIAFESESFAKLKILERNAYNIFIYAIPMPTEGRVAYRYWIDGLWQHDLVNPNYYLDNYEVAISLFENDNPSLIRSSNPIVVGADYDFYAYFDPGEHVYILGNFNNWNPFISPLKEIDPGKYYIRIKHLQPGEYQYYFGVGGFKRLDSRNFQVAVNDEGQRVSIFTVNPQK